MAKIAQGRRALKEIGELRSRLAELDPPPPVESADPGPSESAPVGKAATRAKRRGTGA